MPRKNVNARKRHRGPSSSALCEALGYVTPRQRVRARHRHVLGKKAAAAVLTAQRPSDAPGTLAL